MKSIAQMVLLVLACSVFLVFKFAYADEKVPTVGTNPQDNVATPEVKGVPKGYFELFSNQPAGVLLSRYLETQVDFSEGANTRQISALKAIQEADDKIKKKMIPELINAYGRLAETDFDRRFMVIDAMTQVGSPEVLDFLPKIVLSNLPEVKRSHHFFGPYENEIVVRLAAVEGVSALATKKYPASEAKLIEIAKVSPEKAIKVAAIQGYLNAPLWKMSPRSYESYRGSSVYKQRVASLKKTLPAKLHALIGTRIMTPADMKITDEVQRNDN